MNFLFEMTSIDIFRAVVDIAIVAYLVDRSIQFIRGTRAASMLFGLLFVVGAYVVARPLGLITVAWLLDKVLSSLILIIVVIFQEDIRRALTKFGLRSFFRKAPTSLQDKVIEDIAQTCERLSKNKIGALIVLQKNVGLEELLDEGVSLDAKLSRKLLYSLFIKDSPLHDGAVLIEGDRIKAAGCVLPLTSDPDLDPSLGTRHRAAMGVSERSDAVVLVVSEQTGAISIVHEGRMQRHLDDAELRDEMNKSLLSDRRGEDAA